MNNGDVCIVSGGSKGLGGSIVEMLLKEGIKVAAFSRRRTTEVDNFYAEYGDSFHWESVDLGDKDGLETFVASVEEKFGKIDGLVNNAAFFIEGPFTEYSFEDIQKTSIINSQSVIYLSLLVAKKMEQRGKGVIVNISSITAAHAAPGNTLYGAVKGSIRSLTINMAKELAPKGIRVNGVMPGFMLTAMTDDISEDIKEYVRKMTPARRLAEPSEVARVVMFLLSDGASFIYGQNIAVDGGVSL